jgi:phosphate transport system substrate-binding protein
MSAEELSQAKSKDREVREFILAYDGLSIIVHPDNSVRSLTMEQLAGVYTGKIKNWKEVGGKDNAIVLYGRQSTSGTFTFFRDSALKADYDKSLRSLEGNQAIVDAIKNDAQGVGYVGAGYVKIEGKVRDDVAIVELKKSKDSEALSPLNKEQVQKLEYPLARKIYQYFPQKTLDTQSSLRDFLRFENSSDGQKLVEAAGFYALSTEDTATNSSFLSSDN